MTATADNVRASHSAMRASQPAPAWLQQRQDRALDQFLAQGFPTLKDEDWRYTNLRALREAQLVAVGSAANSAVPALAVEGVHLRIDPAAVRIAPELPSGMRAMSLRDACASNHPLAARVGEITDAHALTAFNDAFAQDAVLLEIQAGQDISQPIVIDWQLPEGASALSSPRLLVVAGANSQATIIEHRVANGGYANGVTELIIDTGATLRYVDVKRDGATSHSLAHTVAQVGRDGRLDALSVALGGTLVRNDLLVKLAERGASAALRGVFIAANSQHIDNHTVLDHAASDTHSVEDYRGIIGALGRGVFNGKVIVRPDAQKITSAQSNDNLLLDDSAEIDTKPELQIYADDVRCSHGATIGRLDEQALFYLRSRGIDTDSAQRMLLDAFAAKAIAGFPDVQLRSLLTDLVTRFLQRDVVGDAT